MGAAAVVLLTEPESEDFGARVGGLGGGPPWALGCRCLGFHIGPVLGGYRSFGVAVVWVDRLIALRRLGLCSNCVFVDLSLIEVLNSQS